MTNSQAKIAHFIKFSFESDILEALLNEGDGVIDRFFIIEGDRPNGRSGRKPLVLDHLLNQPRMQKFRSKIVRFVVESDGSFGWNLEYKHEQSRWEQFLKWNDVHHEFNETDVLLFGDCDEIPAREVLQYFRSCVMEGPVDIGTWFTNSNAYTRFLTDFPIQHSPFLLGSPTAFTLRQALKIGEDGYPTRTRGKAGREVWGGIHLTYYGYLPNLALKLMSMTEQDSAKIRRIREIYHYLQQGESVSTIWKHCREWLSTDWDPTREEPIEGDLENDGFIIPWFIKCNPGRYQYFFGTDIDDPRIT
jgi:hypothetical protein